MKLVFIVGDGFSISYRNHLEVRDVITRQLLPPPSQIVFRPQDDEDPPAGNLFREDTFPELWKLWHEIKVLFPEDDYKVYQEVIKRLADTSSGNSHFITHLFGLTNELRHYLWHLFVEYDQIIKKSLIEKFGEPEDVLKIQLFYYSWEFGKMIQRLNRNFDCSFISYNYDLVLERVLSSMQFELAIPTSFEEHKKGFKKHQKLVIKPHGSINLQTNFGFKSLPISSTSPMFVMGYSNPTYAKNDYTERPNIFDIVPPGHAGKKSIANPYFDVCELAKKEISEADIVVLCGLSAAEPDTPEIKELLACGKENAVIIHIGLRDDYNNDAGELLRGFFKDYHFVEVSNKKLLNFPAKIWNMGNEKVVPPKQKDTKTKTDNMILIDSYQPFNLYEVKSKDEIIPCGSVLFFISNPYENVVKGCRFCWELITESGMKQIVPTKWFDLNVDSSTERFEWKPNYIYGVTLLVAHLPLTEKSDLYLMQDENFDLSIEGNQIVLFEHIQYVRANLVLLNSKEIRIGHVNFEFHINRKIGEVVYKFWQKENEAVNTLNWKPNPIN